MQHTASDLFYFLSNEALRIVLLEFEALLFQNRKHKQNMLYNLPFK